MVSFEPSCNSGHFVNKPLPPVTKGECHKDGGGCYEGIILNTKSIVQLAGDGAFRPSASD
jgi:hypothetical protein